MNETIEAIKELARAVAAAKEFMAHRDNCHLIHQLSTRCTCGGIDTRERLEKAVDRALRAIE